MKNFWTLVRFELKKILSRKITWIAFGIVFMVMLTCGIYRIFTSHEVDGVRVTAHEEEIQIKEKVKKLAGQSVDDMFLTGMFDAMADKETFQTYSFFYNEVARNLIGEALSTGSVEAAKESLGIAPEAELIYSARRSSIEENLESQYLTEGEKDYWKKILDSEMSIPWEYDYYQGVQYAWVAAYTAIVLIALMLAVCLANLFADEHQKKTDQMVLCTSNGKKVLFGAKIMAGMLFTMVSTGVILLVTAVPQLILFGTDGWHAPIQLLIPESMVQMTFGEMIGYTYLVAMIASLLYSSIILCCSELFRNSTVAVMAVIVVLVLVPMMVYVPYEYRVLSQIFDLNPINVLAIWSTLDYRLIPFFGTYLTVYQVAPVLYLVLAGGFLWIGGKAYRNYQVSGR